MYYKRNSSYKSASNSRNHFNSNNTVINLVNIIYDDEFVSLINNLSSSLKDYFKLLNKLLNNIREITSTLGNQTLYSKCLLNECISLYKNTKTDKLLQISDRIDIIDNNKKLLDNNISLIDANMSSFLEKAKILFKKMKTTRNKKLNNTIKKQKYIQNNNKINNNLNMNNNYNSNDSFKIRRHNYSSNNNIRYNHQYSNSNKNLNQNNFCSNLKKNKISKSYSKNLLSNNDILNIEYNNIKNDFRDVNDLNKLNDRQKTISFNLRQFLFKSNKNKLDNPLEKSNESYNIKNPLINSKNSLLNYCTLINNSKTKNNRNFSTRENIKYKKISSFNNDISESISNNVFKNSLKNMNMNNISNNIYDYKHCWNKGNLDLKNYN